MSELKVDVAEQQADNAANAEFQRRASLAKEPAIEQLAVGQRLEVFTPFHRTCTVIKKAETSVIVETESGVDKDRVISKEVWALREIDIEDPKAEGAVMQTHLIVVQDTRPPWLQEASPLVVIDEDTGKVKRGLPSLVKAVPLKETNALEQESKEQGSETTPEAPKRRGRPPKHKASG